MNNDQQPNMNKHQRRWVGLGGLALVLVLLVTVFTSPQTPDATTGAAQVAKFVHSNRGGLYLNAYLSSLAVLVGAVFLWYLRDVVAPAIPGRRLANLGFAGAILFLVGGIYNAGTSFAMADVAKHADPTVLQTLNIFSEDVNSFDGGATAVLMGATSLGILRSKALPSWLAYVGLVLAVASLVLPFLGLLGVGIWVLLTTITILATSTQSKVTGELVGAV